MAVDISSTSKLTSQYFVETDEEMERRFRDLSKGLAETVPYRSYKIVQFIHQSVIDFFVEDGFQLLDRSQRGAQAGSFASHSHFQLSETCVKRLAVVKERLAMIKEFVQQPFNETDKKKLYLDFPFLGYSAMVWIVHAQKCEKEHLSAGNILSYFHSLDLYDTWLSLDDQFRYGSGIIATHIASWYNLPRTLHDLLTQGVKADPLDREGQTPLSFAARRGHETIVKILLERDDVEADGKDLLGRTPLSWAAETGHEAIVRLLLSRDDVEADSKDAEGRTPLSYASLMECERVVKILVERDDVNGDGRDLSGKTPLFVAAEEGHEAIVRLLIEEKAVDVNTKDLSGRTPLSRAVEERHAQIVSCLIGREDVDVNSKDPSGRTQLSRAAEAGRIVIVWILLGKTKVDVNLKDPLGRTPLSWAAENGQEVIVRLLLSSDDVIAVSKDADGKTPLWYATEALSSRGNYPPVVVRERYEKVIKLLERHLS